MKPTPEGRKVLLQAQSVFCTQCRNIAVQSDYKTVTSDECYRLHDDDWPEFVWCCIARRPRRRWWSIHKYSLKVGTTKSAWTITFLLYPLQNRLATCNQTIMLRLSQLCQVPGTLVKDTALMLNSSSHPLAYCCAKAIEEWAPNGTQQCISSEMMI